MKASKPFSELFIGDIFEYRGKRYQKISMDPNGPNVIEVPYSQNFSANTVVEQYRF